MGVWHGLISVRALKNKPLFFIYTVGIWCMYLLSTWCGFFAIDETSGSDLPTHSPYWRWAVWV